MFHFALYNDRKNSMAGHATRSIVKSIQPHDAFWLQVELHISEHFVRSSFPSVLLSR